MEEKECKKSGEVRKDDIVNGVICLLKSMRRIWWLKESHEIQELMFYEYNYDGSAGNPIEGSQLERRQIWIVIEIMEEKKPDLMDEEVAVGSRNIW